MYFERSRLFENRLAARAGAKNFCYVIAGIFKYPWPRLKEIFLVHGGLRLFSQKNNRWLVCVLQILLWAAFGGADAWASGFQLISPDIQDKAVVPMRQVFNAGGCSGGNISPALNWRQAPGRTRSFAVTVFDPDAGPSGFYHWVVFGIPATVASLPRNAGAVGARLMPAGATQIRNGFGLYGYGGPCPPQTGLPHHYVFTIYALDVAGFDDLNAESPAAAVSLDVDRHMLAEARLRATYP